jgi:glutamate--cysteine ligase
VDTLTEQAAWRFLADRALDPAAPGFVGAAVDLPLAAPGLPPALVEALAGRPPLRHGFRTARSPRLIVVSGPPSPGLEACLDRMTQDLTLAQLGGPTPAADGATAEAGIRVGLEAGLDGGGPLGLARRWALAHTLAPVLAAAFAATPLRDGRPTGWRSTRQARHRDRPVRPAGSGDPRAAWAGYVLDAGLRERFAAGSPPTVAELIRHTEALRPPVAARGHLELDVADRQSGRGWAVVVAVTAALLDDPKAAAAAEEATDGLAAEPRLWERAARDALTDPVLAAAARECFVAAYAALSRQGVARGLRDAVAAFTEEYVLTGRCPADDVLDRLPAQARSPVM